MGEGIDVEEHEHLRIGCCWQRRSWPLPVEAPVRPPAPGDGGREAGRRPDCGGIAHVGDDDVVGRVGLAGKSAEQAAEVIVPPGSWHDHRDGRLRQSHARPPSR